MTQRSPYRNLGNDCNVRGLLTLALPRPISWICMVTLYIGHDQPTGLPTKCIWFFITCINQRNVSLPTLKISKTCGFSGIWQSQDVINSKWLTIAVKQKLKDQYLQNWYSLVNTASRGKNYKIFKEEFEQSKYVKILSNMYCKIFMRFRTRTWGLDSQTITALGNCTEHFDTGQNLRYLSQKF